MERCDYFIELYGTLPRAGPGDADSTKRAWDMIRGLPRKPRILDVGCGPGAQTIQLLQRTEGSVVALDILPQMIVRVRQSARHAGVADRLETVQGDMHQMDFAPASFDVVWSEGAIYLMGFETGLRRCKELVKPGGYVAVSEAVGEAEPPLELVDFWRQYPDIDTVNHKLDIISRLGYEQIGSFVLPDSAWTASYYDPMARKIEQYETTWRGIPDAESVLSEARQEIAMFERYSRYYGYAFFVMRV